MTRRTHVLVGYDATSGSRLALAWAVEEARLRGLALTVCHVCRRPYPAGHADPDDRAAVRRRGELLLGTGATLAAAVPVRTALAEGPVDGALLHEGCDAELMVIGSHPPGELPAGSTALSLPALARRPVVVVRDVQEVYGRVVVGTNGLKPAEEALAFGFREAALRGWQLSVVHGCWEPGAARGHELALYGDRAELTRVSHDRLERAVARRQDEYPQVDVKTSTLPRAPRGTLLDAAGRAGLIVVGDRRPGRLDPYRLGTTARMLVRHAPCPVAVVCSEREGPRRAGPRTLAAVPRARCAGEDEGGRSP